MYIVLYGTFTDIHFCFEVASNCKARSFLNRKRLTPDHLRNDLNLMKGHGLMLRESDQLAGNTSTYPCPVCGEAYETTELLKRHIEFNVVIENADEKPGRYQGDGGGSNKHVDGERQPQPRQRQLAHFGVGGDKAPTGGTRVVNSKSKRGIFEDDYNDNQPEKAER